MNKEQQRIAIAEACGITHGVLCTITDFLNNLNAMHEAERMFENDSALRALYIENLEIVTQCPFSVSEWYCATATAAQRSESFLRTIGKWVEE